MMLFNIGGENVVSTRNVSDFVLIQFKTTSDFRIEYIIHWRFKNTEIAGDLGKDLKHMLFVCGHS